MHNGNDELQLNHRFFFLRKITGIFFAKKSQVLTITYSGIALKASFGKEIL
jgi:hypothetical protein